MTTFAFPVSVFRRIRQLFHELGWKKALLYAISKGLVSVSNGWARMEVFTFVAQPVPDKPMLGAGRGAGIEVDQATMEDPIRRSFPRPETVIENRFKQNALCFTARRQGRFVGFLWLVTDVYDEDVVRAHFVLPEASRSVWDFDVYVEPESRLGFTFLRLWDCAYDWMREEGYRWTLSRISVFNEGSRRAHQRLGAREIGSAMFLCLGQAQIMFATCAPYVHVSWARARPLIRLSPPEIAETIRSG